MRPPCVISSPLTAAAGAPRWCRPSVNPCRSRGPTCGVSRGGSDSSGQRCNIVVRVRFRRGHESVGRAPLSLVATMFGQQKHQQQPSRGGTGSSSSSRQKITSALQVIRKNAVYRSIVTRLGNANDTPKKCKKSSTPAQTSASTADDGGFGDWRTEGLPEHSHRRPSPPSVVPRSVSDYGVVVRSSGRRQHVSDTKRVEEAYRRGFCDGSVADVFLMRQTAAAAAAAVVVQEQHQHQPQSATVTGRRRRPSSMEFADGLPWSRLSSSSTVPAGFGCASTDGDRVPSKSPTVVVHHRSLPASASRYQRHRRLSLPVSSAGVGYSSSSSSPQGSIDVESPSATVPTKAAAIALHQLIECYRNGYRVTDHKIALMLDILDTQQRLAKV